MGDVQVTASRDTPGERLTTGSEEAQHHDTDSDVMTREQRGRCMSRIRGRDTKPELMLRRALWQGGLRYRLHCRLPGRPDIVFPARRIAVFVDGCFWHQCPEHATLPKNNRAFWQAKLEGNRRRDAEVNALLRAEGWTVLRIWEHEIRRNASHVAERIARMIRAASDISATAST